MAGTLARKDQINKVHKLQVILSLMKAFFLYRKTRFFTHKFKISYI